MDGATSQPAIVNKIIVVHLCKLKLLLILIDASFILQVQKTQILPVAMNLVNSI